MEDWIVIKKSRILERFRRMNPSERKDVCLKLVGVSIASMLIWLKTVRKDVIVADVKVVIL